MLNLKNITLLAINGHETNLNTPKALKYSCNNIKFGSVKYLTANDDKLNFCETIKIPKMSYEEYNALCLSKLHEYVETDFILIIQDDGFLINPESWSDLFLSYDYIGAPWDKTRLYYNLEIKEKEWMMGTSYTDILKNTNTSFNIGNGGFSLRSKKLLIETSKLYITRYGKCCEDSIISIIMREDLEKEKIRFPENDKIAASFSCETKSVNGNFFSSDNSLGFHCRDTHKDKIDLLNSIEFSELIESNI